MPSKLNVTARVEEATAKSGKSYIRVIVTFPNGYEKLVFLEKAEEFLVKSLIQK